MSLTMTLPAIIVVGYAVWYALLYYRVLPRVAMQATFLVALGVCMTMTALLTLVIDGLFHRTGLISRYRSTRLCTAVSVFFFRLQILLNPQIRIHHPTGIRQQQKQNNNKKKRKNDDDDGCDHSESTEASTATQQQQQQPLCCSSWAEVPKGAMLLANHTSMMDPFTMCAITPLAFVANGRPMYKAALHNIPFFGPIFTRSGYFPVHFTKDTAGCHSVDKARQEGVLRDMEHFAVAEGGTLALFPEGRVNPNPDPEEGHGGGTRASTTSADGGDSGVAARDDNNTVLPIRWGAIRIAIQHNIPIVVLAMWGARAVWPPERHVKVGGFPADVHYVIGRIEPSELMRATRRERDGDHDDDDDSSSGGIDEKVAADYVRAKMRALVMEAKNAAMKAGHYP